MANRRFSKPPEGSIIVLSAPSGSGKSTIIRRLLASLPQLRFSVSYTTRAPRSRERDGREYFFVSEDRFKRMVGAGEFAEWANVYGHYYGTSVRQLRRAQRAGEDILLDIDVQGHHWVRRRLPESLGVFVIPPSYQELRRRLVHRRSDSPEAIRKRLLAAREEIRHWREYDYVLVNDDVGETAHVLRDIILAARQRSGCQRRLVEKIVKSFGG